LFSVIRCQSPKEIPRLRLQLFSAFAQDYS
jgi:hypothetical protein